MSTQQTFTRCARLLALSALLALTGTLHAEQLQRFGDYEVHYIVIPTTFLKAEVAARYDLTRSRNRALVNVSILDIEKAPVAAVVNGRSENLLGQGQVLRFEEIREGPAIYYLALLRHGDEEFHRITIDVDLPDGTSGEIRFQQKMYWED